MYEEVWESWEGGRKRGGKSASSAKGEVELREEVRQREERSGVTVRRSQDTWIENKVSIFSHSSSFFLSLSPSTSHSYIFYPSPLVSNLIFITAESLKQFTWSASYMKIDNCDPPFLPGKQKRRAVVTWDCMLSTSVCEGRGATGGQ